MTRRHSALTKESRHLTFAGSTVCWSPGAWTDLCACGTHIFQGEKSQWILQVYLDLLGMSDIFFPFSFSRKPAGILKGHRAPISYLCISSEDSQIFSVSVDNAVKVIFFFYDSFFFGFRNQSLILSAQVSGMCQRLFFSPKLLKCLCCGSPDCVSGLGYSGAALFAHSGLWGKWDPWWHYCVLVLLHYEIPLCCRWQHGCAFPEEKVGGCASVLCSWKNLLLFSVYIWENLSIDLFWFLRDHFHNNPAEQWFSQRFVQIAACLLLIFPSSDRLRPHGRFIISHEEPVICCGFCEEFRQVVSCSEGSVRNTPTRTVIQ